MGQLTLFTDDVRPEKTAPPVRTATTPSQTRLVTIALNGVPLTIGQTVQTSLTDMWRAAGSPPNRDPAQWRKLPQAVSFIDAVVKGEKLGKSHVFRSMRGRGNKGVWAHWQVALAYAKYLSPEFHRQINELVREWVDEANDPDLKADRAIAGYRRQGRDSEWIGQRLSGKVERFGMTDQLKAHHVKGVGYSDCSDNINLGTLGAKSKALKAELGVPAHKSLRDHLSRAKLAALALAEALAAETIEQQAVYGNKPCAAVCLKAGTIAGQALRSMRA